MSKNNYIKITLGISLFFIASDCYSQTIDIGAIGKGKAFKISGGVSASSIFFNSNQSGSRVPFTYFLQGSLNLSLYQFSLPISYSYSNQGGQFSYNLPFNINRLSLHPKYKWIQAHIGDVAMSFSPYTLNGYQFTGGGLDLTPKGPFSISLMYGRLLKATEYDGNPRTIPAFRRMGFGTKLGFRKEKYSVNLILFYAKDKINSISVLPDSIGIKPKENLVISIDGSYKILQNLEFKGEYASTAITQDLRSEKGNSYSQGLAGLLFNNRSSTEHYTAIKTALTYSFAKSTLGVGYERIGPGYQTLGAYFFNNDLENITINSTTRLFKDKVNLAFNIGYQRDNLENQKKQSTGRTVGSVNATVNASKKLTLGASYSNFSTFTNVKLNQFDMVNSNQPEYQVNKDLNYVQLSQNASINANYVISKNENKNTNINISYSLADVSNKQGGIVRTGNASSFHNTNLSYSLGLPKKDINITVGMMATLNTIGTGNTTTWGPTLGFNKKLLNKKLNTGFFTSFNSSNSTKGSNSNITNIRITASYVLKEKHNFNLNAYQLFNSLSGNNTQSLTINFGYGYSF